MAWASGQEYWTSTFWKRINAAMPSSYTIYYNSDDSKYCAECNIHGGTAISANADATTVIQAAIDALPAADGGLIYLKPGSYEISQTIMLKKYVGLLGELGGDATKLTLAHNVNDDLIRYEQSASGASWIYLGHLTLDGDGANQTAGHIVYLKDAGNQVMDFMMDRCFLYEAKQHGLYVDNGWGIHVRETLSEYCLDAGFYINASQTYFSDCFAASNKNGFVVRGTNQHYKGCQASGNTANGFYTILADRCQFTNTLGVNNTSRNYFVTQSTRCKFIGFISDGDTSKPVYGLVLEGTAGNKNQKNSFMNGDIFDSSGNGIRISDTNTEDTRFSDLDISGNGAPQVNDLGLRTIFNTRLRNFTVLDLSGGATDVEVFHALKSCFLAGYRILYTEASSADAGVIIRVGRYQDGVALDDDYFDSVTSETSENKGYAKDYITSDLTNTAISAGDTLTVGTAGGKTGTGEVLLILNIAGHNP